MHSVSHAQGLRRHEGPPARNRSEPSPKPKPKQEREPVDLATTVEEAVEYALEWAASRRQVAKVA